MTTTPDPDSKHGTVLSLGEALVEFMPPVGQTMREAATWEKFAGGGPATYAAAMVRFGRPSALLSRVGADPFSQYMLDELTREGVDTSQIVHTADHQIGLCFHECIEGRTQLIFHRLNSAATILSPDDLDTDLIASAAALHVAGTTMQISQSAMETVQTAMRCAHEASVPISFDPNIRTISGAARAIDAMEEALSLADIVTPSLKEASEITGCDDPVKAALELRARGPRMVAVTLAGEGCVLAVEGAPPVRVHTYPVRAIEPTGSGDVHAAAFMHGYLAGWEPDRIGSFANAAGALAVTAVGHFGEALPTFDRLEQLIAGNPSV
ncbi:MAG: sugar kinase [Gemmatimonadetes bacterium]|nr:sugar kinase [Gemmatimonadota bacterium]MBT7861884.1 sugar kinase [Gemmatimonadota bacterium]